jgi:hypothetical protein
VKNYGNYIKEESWGSGKNEDFDGQYIENEKDNYKYIGYDVINFEKIVDESKEIDKKEIEKYVTISTIKSMFPIYYKFNFLKDWSIRLYEYRNYFFIYKSGYYYTFEKK